MKVTLHNNTYKGPRWRYGLTLRPLLSSSLPDSFIIHSDRVDGAYRHGTIDYPHPLGQDVIKREDMVFIAHIKGQGAPIDYTPIGVGMTVVRLAERTQERPRTGVVEEIKRDWRREDFRPIALVRWHGAKRTTVSLGNLMRWVAPGEGTALRKQYEAGALP